MAALEALRATPTQHSGLSRRAFLSATLAAAALLTLPIANTSAASGNQSMTGARSQKAGAPQNGTVPVSLQVNGKTRKLQLELRSWIFRFDGTKQDTEAAFTSKTQFC